MDLPHFLKKQFVDRHGIVDPRGGHGVDPGSAEHRDEDRQGDEYRPGGPQHGLHRIGSHPFRSRNRLQRQQHQIGEVDQQVDHHHDRGAGNQRERDGALLVFYLAGHVGGMLPAAEGPQHPHHGDRQGAPEILRIPGQQG